MAFETADSRRVVGKFFWASLLGYGYIFFILTVLAAIFLLGVVVLFIGKAHYSTVHVLIVTGFFFFMIAQSLWIRITPPGGRILLPMEAPELFQLIAALRRKLKAPPIHRVLVTSDFNAGIFQHPQWGILGGYKNILQIGLPLMETLSAAQFQTIMAHELAHISRQHGIRSLWAYRLTTAWQNLSKKFEGKRTWTDWIFRPFFRRFMPYYREVSLAYSRLHEYESDAFAAVVTGSEEMARALLRTAVMGETSQNYWKGLDQSVQTKDLPPGDVYQGSIAYMRKAFALENSGDILARMMGRNTMPMDSHPALRDRLGALKCFYSEGKILDGHGQALSFDSEISETAADALIRKNIVDEWHKGLTADWGENYKKGWYRQRELFYQNQTRLQELVEKPELSLDELWERAKIQNDLKRADEAARDFTELIGKGYKESSCKLLLGSILLEKNDGQGILLIDEGLKVEPNYGVWAAQQVLAFFQMNGNNEQAGHWYRRYFEYVEMDRLANIERQSFLLADPVEAAPHDEKLLEFIHDKIRQDAEVSRAYLVAKKVEYYPNLPVYHLVIELKHKVFSRLANIQDHQQYFLQQPWPCRIFITTHNWHTIARVRDIPGSLIYGDEKGIGRSLRIFGFIKIPCLFPSLSPKLGWGIIGIFFLLGVGVSVLGATHARWREFSSPEGNFAVMLPGTPRNQRTLFESRLGRVEYRTFSSRKTRNVFYAVSYSDFLGDLDTELNVFYEQTGVKLAQASGGEVISKKKVFLQGNPGMEIQIKTAKSTSMLRMFLVKRKLYQISAVVAGKGPVPASDIEKFFNSFRLSFSPAGKSTVE